MDEHLHMLIDNARLDEIYDLRKQVTALEEKVAELEGQLAYEKAERLNTAAMVEELEAQLKAEKE